jgi:hypothetical protein
MNRDIFIACILEHNHTLMLSLLEQSRKRMIELGGGGSEATATITKLLDLAKENCLHCQVVFLSFLNMDVELKKTLQQGVPRYKLSGLSDAKAVLFYRYLEDQVMLPWLIDETMAHTQMLKTAREMYLVA